MPQSIPGAKRMFDAIARQGYTPETAVADLVDNSIAADARLVKISLADLPGGFATRVVIADDGKGMSFETLEKAMQLGSPESLANGPLSRFGMGMKAASLTFSPKMSVYTRHQGRTSFSSWDKRIQEERPFELELNVATPEEERFFSAYKGDGDGTVVVWDFADFRDVQASDGSAGGSKLANQISDYLGFAFHKYLTDIENPVEITVNNGAVTVWDPVDTKYRVGKEDWEPISKTFFEKVTSNGADEQVPFVVTVYVVRGKDDYETSEEMEESRIGPSWSGLYSYREGRALQMPTWDDDYYKQHANLNAARIVLEYDQRLDDAFHTPVNKSKIVIPNSIKKSISEWLKPILLSVRKLRGQTIPKPGPDREQRAHNASNGILARTADVVDGPTFIDGDDGKVIVENGKFGPGEFHLPSVPADAAAQRRRIVLVDELRDGVLFEPLRRGNDGVVINLNKNHEFYKKIYLPLLNNSEGTTGLDLLLYAVTNAELMTSTDRVRAQFETMRFEMSKLLRIWVSELDYPEDEDFE